MVYYSDSLAPIIESIYLEEPIDSSLPHCNIVVNPKNLSYIYGKTIIINDPSYDWSEVVSLAEGHGCRVISRYSVPFPDILVQPYLIRINPHLLWSGEVLERDPTRSQEEILDSLVEKDDQHFRYDPDKRILYFPKIPGQFNPGSALAWALHQVGENQEFSGKFQDLDVLKLYKW